MDILFAGKENQSPVGTNSWPDFIENLRINILQRGMHISEQIAQPLTSEDICGLLTFDPEIIRSRNAILKDFITHPTLIEAFTHVVTCFGKIRELMAGLQEISLSKFRKPLLCYRLLVQYEQVTRILSEALADDGLCTALIHVRKEIEEARRAANIDHVMEELSHIDLTFLDFKALEVGLGCGVVMKRQMKKLAFNETFVFQLFSLHFSRYQKDKYKADTIFEKPEELQNGIGRLKAMGSLSSPDLDNAILMDLAFTHKKQFRRLKKSVVDIVKPCTELLQLERGCVFYLSAMAFHQTLVRSFPLCFAKIHEGDFLFGAEGLYSCGMALEGANPVANDIRLDNRFQILTGANNSGKTEFLVSFALAQLMFQLGLFVPAKAMTASPVARLHTLFMGGEDEDYRDSRMGEELTRFKTMMQTLEADSTPGLVLLNEPLTSTSASEGQKLCADIVRFMIEHQLFGILVTHFYGLYQELVASKGGRVASLITITQENENGINRTYKIIEAPPEGKSFAVEMAAELGLMDTVEGEKETLQ